MPDPGREKPREQNNYGLGPLIGGDNFGDINYQMLDPKTKAALAKLSQDAPGLAGLLARALRDGIISPDIVAALENAVRCINEDVADALLIAGRNINEDVADKLWYAGKNINDGVAEKLVNAGDSLEEAINKLDSITFSLNESLSGNPGASRPVPASKFTDLAIDSYGPSEYRDRTFASRLVVWKIRLESFIIGVAVGSVTIGILIQQHVKPF